jgi:tRNA threonylcarbamoyladenosine biosynthesis protein TsaB
MINIMKILIIDAAAEKIFLGLILNKNVYTGTYINSKKNYDKLTILVNKFLLKYKTNLDKIKRIYINRGPGSYAGIRNSISIVKAIHLSKKIDFYSYSYLDFKNKKKIGNEPINLKNIRELPNLCNKFNIKKNLIKPIYLS